MKIDIHITDATPEEAARIMLASQRAEAATEAEKIKPESRLMKRFITPDPQPGQTGCEGCRNTEFDAATCEECSPDPKKRPARDIIKAAAAKVNKFGIPPSLFGKDKKKYQRLWYLCKKHGITYEGALKKDQDLAAARKNKAQAKKKSGGKAKPSAKAIAPSNEGKKPPVPVTMDKAPACEIVTGLHVRQIKSDQGRQIFGTGVVLARHGGIVEVRNGGGKAHKIDAKCLEIVPTGEVSDRATGASS